MTLLQSAAVGVLLVATAPVQCGQTPESELSLDETPGDALWQLAQRFEAEHDEPAARQTMRFLIERYPASRWAHAARKSLADGGGVDGGG